MSLEQQIDLALCTAWKAATNGTWQIPYKWAKAFILDQEYQAYLRKYQESGTLSGDLKALENDVCKLLGYSFFDLEKRIVEDSPHVSNQNLLPAVLEYDSNTNIDFNDDFTQKSSSTEMALKHNNNSELLKNFALYEKLERQGYFKIDFADDGITFKTNPVNNQQYSSVLQDIKIDDDEDVYLTLKLSKNILIVEDATNQNCLYNKNENNLLTY